MLRGTCIGFLPDAGCGLIYAENMLDDSDGSHIVFIHFRDIVPEDGWQGLKRKDIVEFVISNAGAKKFGRYRMATGENNGFVSKIQDAPCKGFVQFTSAATHAFEPLLNDGRPFVVTGDIPDGWIPKKAISRGDVIFSGCRWQGKATFSKWKVDGDLVFLGCSFKDSFTLKDACVAGNVHMEGCDFSGNGGASFRGLQAQALYLDFGVKGPCDMVWLNEIHIQQNINIGGAFAGGIQVFDIQDERVKSETATVNSEKNRACFKHLFIGKEFYRSQNINRTRIEGGLEIDGLHHGEEILMEHVLCGEITLVDIGKHIDFSCKDSRILGNVLIRGRSDIEKSCAPVKRIDFEGSYIEGHVQAKNIQIAEVLSLDDATVERVIRLSDITFSDGGGIKIARLSANRLVMDDFSRLYGQKTESAHWSNPRFLLLKREHEIDPGQAEPPSELVQEYVLLKHLLSQEGQLKLEDEAFYNMRKLGHWKQNMGMFVFNYVFGWGVRLWNILISVAVFILFFVAIYQNLLPDAPLKDVLLLSIQAMFMAFFGEWHPAAIVGDGISWVVTSESVLGVIFVTVFVGAYVRKLLR